MNRFSGCLRTVGTAFLDILLPPCCPVCHQRYYGDEPLHICPDCLEKLPLIGDAFCSICGIPFVAGDKPHPCSRCIKNPPPYSAARAAFMHAGDIKELIHRFKYNGDTRLRRSLGLLTAEKLAKFAKESSADLIVPIPLHNKRLKNRGFNQALLLAEIFSKAWQIPLQRHLIKRTRLTVPQVELGRKQRLSNLHDAFMVADQRLVAGKTIMLVDDVTTTGSTLWEASAVLKKAGARKVLAVTISHAA